MKLLNRYQKSAFEARPIGDTKMRKIDQLLKVISSEFANSFSSSMRSVVASPPYRELVSYGLDALPAIVSELQIGEFHLARAVLEILNMSVDMLPIENNFPAEQDIANALCDLFDRAFAILDGEIVMECCDFCLSGGNAKV